MINNINKISTTIDDGMTTVRNLPVLKDAMRELKANYSPRYFADMYTTFANVDLYGEIIRCEVEGWMGCVDTAPNYQVEIMVYQYNKITSVRFYMTDGDGDADGVFVINPDPTLNTVKVFEEVAK